MADTRPSSPGVTARGRRRELYEAPQPPEPWRKRPDDFLCCPLDAIPDGARELFDKQCELLGELVTPVTRGDELIRSCPSRMVGSYRHSPKDAYFSYLKATLDSRAERSAGNLPDDRFLRYDVVVFDYAGGGLASLVNVNDLAEIPFQGVGRFALAILPSNVRRRDLDVTFAKIALSRFLEAVPQDIECVVVTRASRFDFKRLKELDDLDLPLLFDFSGRASGDKAVIDPVGEAIVSERKLGRTAPCFKGNLTPEQAQAMGGVLDKENSTEMVKALAMAATGRAATWPLAIANALCFDHEDFSDVAAPHELPGLQASMSRPSVAWQMDYAQFPPESMPTSDASAIIGRMRDVGEIWRNALSRFNVELSVEYDRDAPSGYSFNEDNVRKLGKLLGIDEEIAEYYDADPVG